MSDTLIDELLATMRRAEVEIGDSVALPEVWARTWGAIPAAQRTASAHALAISALRTAHELLESANSAHMFKLDVRSERLDGSVRALCYLAAMLQKLAQDADMEDSVR